MSVESLPSLGGFFGDDSDSGDDTQNRDYNRRGSMLGSVFGLGSGSFLKGMRGVTGALSKSYSNAPPGLGNWDNSCYQNSVIQGMASLPSLREYLSKTTTEYNTLGNDSTNGALFELINKLNDPENHGQHFWIRGKLKSMSTFQQQDAQEYYSKIMDALDKEAQNATNSKRKSTASWLLTAKNLSNSPATTPTAEESGDEHREKTKATEEQSQPQPIPNPLDGLLAQRVGCINCGYSEGLSLIPFNCITVPLGKKWSYDVQECLDEYTNLELIEGVECAKCTVIKTQKTLSKLSLAPDSPFASRLKAVEEALEEEDFEDKTLIKKCGVAKKNWVQSTKSRQAVIARAPKSLVLHVNRSIFDEMTGAQYKNTASVSYPKVLDLGNWCLGSRPSESQSVDESVEEWPRDPKKSMLGDPDAEPTTNSPFQYTLRAAVTHFGSHGNGHYVCYRNQPYVVKKATSSDDSEDEEQEETGAEQWWRISDEISSPIMEEQALRQGGVFMLFYERVDTNAKVSPPPGTKSRPLRPVTISDSAPLPPQEISSVGLVVDHTALEVPLPDDDDEIFPFSPPESPILPSTASHPHYDASDYMDLDEPMPELVDIGPGTAAYPTPPPDSTHTLKEEDIETSENDSDDTPSTELTSDDDVEGEADSSVKKEESTVHLQPNHSSSPQLMRTAGGTQGRGKSSQARLPLVTAT